MSEVKTASSILKVNTSSLENYSNSRIMLVMIKKIFAKVTGLDGYVYENCDDCFPGEKTASYTQNRLGRLRNQNYKFPNFGSIFKRENLRPQLNESDALSSKQRYLGNYGTVNEFTDTGSPSNNFNGIQGGSTAWKQMQASTLMLNAVINSYFSAGRLYESRSSLSLSQNISTNDTIFQYMTKIGLDFGTSQSLSNMLQENSSINNVLINIFKLQNANVPSTDVSRVTKYLPAECDYGQLDFDFSYVPGHEVFTSLGYNNDPSSNFEELDDYIEKLGNVTTGIFSKIKFDLNKIGYNESTSFFEDTDNHTNGTMYSQKSFFFDLNERILNSLLTIFPPNIETNSDFDQLLSDPSSYTALGVSRANYFILSVLSSFEFNSPQVRSLFIASYASYLFNRGGDFMKEELSAVFATDVFTDTVNQFTFNFESSSNTIADNSQEFYFTVVNAFMNLFNLIYPKFLLRDRSRVLGSDGVVNSRAGQTGRGAINPFDPVKLQIFDDDLNTNRYEAEAAVRSYGDGATFQHITGIDPTNDQELLFGSELIPQLNNSLSNLTPLVSILSLNATDPGGTSLGDFITKHIFFPGNILEEMWSLLALRMGSVSLNYYIGIINQGSGQFEAMLPKIFDSYSSEDTTRLTGLHPLPFPEIDHSTYALACFKYLTAAVKSSNLKMPLYAFHYAQFPSQENLTGLILGSSINNFYANELNSPSIDSDVREILNFLAKNSGINSGYTEQSKGLCVAFNKPEVFNLVSAFMKVVGYSTSAISDYQKSYDPLGSNTLSFFEAEDDLALYTVGHLTTPAPGLNISYLLESFTNATYDSNGNTNLERLNSVLLVTKLSLVTGLSGVDTIAAILDPFIQLAQYDDGYYATTPVSIHSTDAPESGLNDVSVINPGELKLPDVVESLRNAGFLYSQSYYTSVKRLLTEMSERRERQLKECRDVLNYLKAYVSKLSDLRNTLIGFFDTPILTSGLDIVKSSEKAGDLAISFIGKEKLRNDIYQLLQRFYNGENSILPALVGEAGVNKFKNIIKYFNTYSHGFLQDDKLGNQKTMFVGLPAGFLEEARHKAFKETRDSSYLKSSLISINVYRRNALEPSEQTYPKIFLFDTSRYIMTSDVNSLLTNNSELFQINDSDDYQQFIDKHIVTKIEIPDGSSPQIDLIDSTDEFFSRILKTSAGKAYSNVVDTNILTPQMQESVFKNLILDYYLKSYYRQMLGLDIDEFSQTFDILDNPDAVDDSKQALFDAMRTELLLAFGVDPSNVDIDGNYDQLVNVLREIKNSVLFKSQTIQNQIIKPRVFDRIFAVYFNEKDFLISRELGQINITSQESNYNTITTEYFESLPLPQADSRLTIQKNNGSVFKQPGASNNLNLDYVRSFEESSSSIYSYYVTVSLLKSPE